MEFCGIAKDGTRVHESRSRECKTQVDVASQPVKAAVAASADNTEEKAVIDKSPEENEVVQDQSSAQETEGQTFSTFVTKKQADEHDHDSNQNGVESVATSSATATAPGTTASSALNVSRDGSLRTQLTELSTGEVADGGAAGGASAEGKAEEVAK